MHYRPMNEVFEQHGFAQTIGSDEYQVGGLLDAGAPILLNRHFAPPAPNQAWSADITDVWTGKGRLYLVIAGALADCVHLNQDAAVIS